ncbi:PREDICTED: thrombomodulin [Chrysochloris asiatica]|uniref:Thrombomodulin n=1 Tax=Chrysochloris asiatica TaxID=185453 RepID=A0A9B0WL62_CHRAS|nr:PREDICTED: thrombomodulin [Chrysochloris asiatica]
MLRVLLLGVLAPASLGFPASPGPQLLGSQCVEHDCFALFRGPATFFAASQACEHLQGHLMTVRSSVAADVISLLLSSDQGVGPRLWIGLKLPVGCHDPRTLGPLRGFQWVTRDNRTSYSRWAQPDNGTALCGPLCTAVTTAEASAPGEPTWVEQQCNAEAEGFLCEFHFAASCRPLVLDPVVAALTNVSDTYNTPFGAGGTDFQALPVGSSASVAALGVELVCAAPPPGTAEARWGREAPGAWDCRVENGGCEHFCHGGSGLPQCLCPTDAALQADGRSCAVQGANSCDDLCDHFCVQNSEVPGAYTCMCETGYQLAADQHRCEDVDDCLLVPSPCPQLCVNTKGGFECQCYSNYELVDGECVELLDPCVGVKCEYQCQPVGDNDYRCICAEGFVQNPLDPNRCQMFCNQTSCPADCDPNGLESCQCPDGYILDEGFMCTDIDECSNDECAGECRNLPGSFECICGPDSPLAGQVSTDCDPIKVNYDGDGGSGEGPTSPTPSTTSGPASSGPKHSGVLIGISIASMSLVVALLALLCHLRKKQGSMRAELEYKCANPSKELVLQRVRTELMPQKL